MACWVTTLASAAEREAVLRRLHKRAFLVWLGVGLPVSYVLRSSLVWLMSVSVYTILAEHFLGWNPDVAQWRRNVAQRLRSYRQ